MENVTILMYLKSRKNAKKESPIYLRLTIDGQRVEKSLNRSIDSKKWDGNRQRGKGSSEQIKALNQYLNTVEHEIYISKQELINNHKRITVETLMNKFLGVDELCHTLVEVVESYNLRIKLLVEGSTYKHYVAALKHVKSYLIHQYKVADIDIKELDYQFVLDYDYYLRTEKKIGGNKTIRYVKTLGRIFRTTINRGWISIDPFVNYKEKIVTKDVVCLTQKEVDDIYKKQFTKKNLERVRDVFIFCCYTGLAYCDVKDLTSNHIVKNIDGYRWVKINRKKSDVVCDIPLFPIAELIIKKYEKDPFVINSGKLLPVLCNQKTNLYLKDIGALSGISKNLHFHMARHNFGTIIAAANRLPIETSMRIMGHKTMAMARHYAKISTVMILEDVAALRLILSESKEDSSEKGNANAIAM